MSISGIQGQPLEVTVVACTKLKDTEWISRQDPYVCVEYGSTKFRTRTCTDGGKNPTFQEKFVITLIEGLREINVVVWNRNTLTYDDFIGGGKILLQKVLSNGYDDSSWPLQDKKGRHAGEIKLIMHCSTANKPAKPLAPSAPPYPAMPAHQAPHYPAHVPPYPPKSIPEPAPQAPHYPAHVPPYPPKSIPEPAPQAPHYPAHVPPYPPKSIPEPASYPSYPPNPAGYPPPPYHEPAAYPPIYPPGPSPSMYPPPPHDPYHHPPGLYPPSPYPPPY